MRQPRSRVELEPFPLPKSPVARDLRVLVVKMAEPSAQHSKPENFLSS